MLIISVKGAGESCSDPDRYLQVMTGESLAKFGVSQSKDLIVQPNYPLLIAMLMIGIGGTAFTMWMVHYCMHKGWYINPMKMKSYRDAQLSKNLHHENGKIFQEGNDFVQHKSNLIDHEEEDLDDANMDIQQDLVDAGKAYLHKYNKRRNKHKKQQTQKRRKMRELLDEVEGLVGVLNSDQAAMQVHWLDLDAVMNEEGEAIDDKAIKRQIEKQMNQISKQEEQQNDQYKAKREELLKNASEREREIHEQARQRLMAEEEQITKDNNRLTATTMDTTNDMQKTMTEFAIYDNGDAKTKNN